MKKKLLLSSLFLLFAFASRAQITGDTVVCSGYTYNYSTSIAGAVTYTWTLPNGWYGLIGQGSSSISASCNVNDGNICVEGFDTNLNSVGIECIATQWGNGGSAGWDIWPSSFYFCSGQPRDVHFMILPNGTGSTSCPGGCGNGTQNPNIIYGLYDNSVPYPQFITEITGAWITMPPVVTTYRVFYVDVAAGFNFPDAVNISGGCGAATVNNTVTTNEVFPLPPQFIQSPDPACVGDTVLITQTESGISTTGWTSNGGLTILSYPDSNEVLVVVTNSNASLSFDGFDQMYFCNTYGSYVLNICTTPSAVFSASMNTICPGTCTDFTNLSINAISYLWIFNGGVPDTSSAINPSNICYGTPGTYDVTLEATGPGGTDITTLTNYITVYPAPPPQSVQQNGDTLISNTGFAIYQWYFNGTLISSATDYFYIATQDGDYNVVCSDSNGCEVEAAIFNVMTSVQITVSDFGFSVYPNPAGKIISVFAGSKNVSPLALEISDVAGRKISTYNILPNRKTQLSLETLAPGIYFVSVKGKEIFAVKKIIRQ